MDQNPARYFFLNVIDIIVCLIFVIKYYEFGLLNVATEQ